MNPMLTVKTAAVTFEVALSWILAAAIDDTATRIVLYAAAGAGLAWFWKNVLRPVAKVLHRMADGVEALEELPSWRQGVDARMDRTETRIKHLELGVGQVSSQQETLLRELGVEDKVRRQFSDPAAFERWLGDADDDAA
jgi:hypothetical protein